MAAEEGLVALALGSDLAQPKCKCLTGDSSEADGQSNGDHLRQLRLAVVDWPVLRQDFRRRAEHALVYPELIVRLHVRRRKATDVLTTKPAISLWQENSEDGHQHGYEKGEDGDKETALGERPADGAEVLVEERLCQARR